MRGVRPHICPLRRFWGITPACAGSTFVAISYHLKDRDHPRVCGEYYGAPVPLDSFLGSPPRVRGVHSLSSLGIVLHGITPACAGSTRNRATNRPRNWDHPRVCGEYCIRTPKRTRMTGSPPRVRGVLTEKVSIRSLAGITPACAGSTDEKTAQSFLNRDHPRVCGEYTISMVRSSRGMGSPPRVRGVLTVANRVYRYRGITPACAGSTPIVLSKRCFRRDHPRVCGEYTAMMLDPRWSKGSPPRVRGVL